MDLSASFQNLNWLAVIIAALSTFIIGGIWYSSILFKNAWLKSNNFTREELKSRNMPMVFGLAFIFSFIMSCTLGMFIGQNGMIFGITAGFITGFCWVFLGMCIIALFENRPLVYVLVNGGYMIVAFTVMGGILGALK